MIKYIRPQHWIKYDLNAIQSDLIEAKSAIGALKMIPYQRSWVESLQHMELKREIAGTSRIEGADFTENELDEALKEDPEQLLTRSQKQAHAAVKTYRWISTLEDEQPINGKLVKEIHRRIVTGADDDHCRPGVLRRQDENVTFGQPRHRGANGGEECKKAFDEFSLAIQREYREHDLIIQALASHYHLAAMHPFLDGNGRSARALEALILQRAGLRDTCFIAMSNYYYDEKIAYLNSLSASRAENHNITSFLAFALKGITLQSRRLLEEIKNKVQKEIFRNLMYDLFARLKTPRKRLIAKRQLNILKLLLENDKMDLGEMYERLFERYRSLKNPSKAFFRDLNGLINIQAIKPEKTHLDRWEIQLRLEWPTEMTETAFRERIKLFPKAKTYSFLR